jgi:heparanase 1
MTPQPVPVYDFTRPRLRGLAGELAPAYLRIGGTDADKTHYDLSATPNTTPPPGYTWVMTAAEWDGAVEFARALDFQIVFTLNAGQGPRVGGSWQPDDARPLVQLAASRGDPVAAWELGNEIDLYTLQGHQLLPASYVADLGAARALLDAAAPGQKLAGPSSAYWPRTGELVPFYADWLAAGGGSAVDIITWHYYPTESDRCPFEVVQATSAAMIDPKNLDEARRLATTIAMQRDAARSTAELWLGETGPAQCGGQRGVSDTFASTFWWLDQLGTLSSLGQRVSVRQTLSGSDYGLLDDVTLDPRPDYWASLLWRRSMDPRALAVTVDDPSTRVYAHCARGKPGAIAIVALNLSTHEATTVSVAALGHAAVTRYLVTADGLDATTVRLEGATLADADGVVPALDGSPANGVDVELPPTSWAFAIVDAGVAACM